MLKKVPICVLAVLATVLLATGCRPPNTLLAPVPEELNEVEGYASLKITKSGETARSKFSFLIERSRRSKVNVTDILGRTIVEISIGERDAYFILPREKVYWKGTPDEIIEKFLGFRLSLPEMTGILCGSWTGAPETQQAFEGWTFEKDREGRRAMGRRADLEFKVRKFFPGSSVPRQVDFQSTPCRGSLFILSINFNKPVAEDLFNMVFLKTHAPKSWEEIEKILRRED